MVTVTVSSKFQIVIPAAIRNGMNISAGQKIQLIPYQGRIELVPIKNIRKMRGFLQGVDTDVPREEDE
jgi:AbrB family looped-hinge helix DNA binding protein